MSEKDNNKWIVFIAVLLPFAVAALYFLPKGGDTSEVIKSIPKFNAILNGTTFLVLVSGLIAIKSRKKLLHRTLMMTAAIMSALFLVGYVIYHGSIESTKFGGEGIIQYIYFFILTTHIILAANLAPLVLITLRRGIKKDFIGHKKIAKWTYPIWLYVSATGLIVYLMISPYY